MEVSGHIHDPVGFTPGVKDPATQWIGACVGFRDGLDAVA
jgi:hypothetical protein